MATAVELLRMTELGNPWCFASYTDEAMEIIAGTRPGMRRYLEQGLSHKQLGYWLGRPEGKGRGVFDRLVSRRYRQLLPSTVLNCPEFINKFPPMIKKCVGVGVRGNKVPPVLYSSPEHTSVVTVKSWDDFNKVRRLTFPRGSFVFLDCGPTGTALAWHWYFRNPRCTVIDMQGVWNADRSSSLEVAPASFID